jgi:16S rRNA C1402 (ribose-2'-O) methylase RsmI
MVENVTERGISTIELMRAVSSNFDDNVIIGGSADVALISGGMSMTMWGKKARLLSGMQFAFSSGMSSSSDLLEQENMQLRNENLTLRDAIRRIEERLTSIEASLPSEKVIILRELSKEEAKNEIKRLFSSGKTFYYSDIAQQLGLDLELVVDICNELQEQREITIDAGVS